MWSSDCAKLKIELCIYEIVSFTSRSTLEFVGDKSISLNVWFDIRKHEINSLLVLFKSYEIVRSSLNVWTLSSSTTLPHIYNLFCRFHCRTAINKCYRLLPRLFCSLFTLTRFLWFFGRKNLLPIWFFTVLKYQRREIEKKRNLSKENFLSLLNFDMAGSYYANTKAIKKLYCFQKMRKYLFILPISLLGSGCE